jgi:hypothetical protein
MYVYTSDKIRVIPALQRYMQRYVTAAHHKINTNVYMFVAEQEQHHFGGAEA